MIHLPAQRPLRTFPGYLLLSGVAADHPGRSGGLPGKRSAGPLRRIAPVILPSSPGGPWRGPFTCGRALPSPEECPAVPFGADPFALSEGE